MQGSPVIFSTKSSKKKIFFAELHLMYRVTYLPHMWVHLKTHCDQSEIINETFYWEDPLFGKIPNQDFLEEWLEMNNWHRPNTFDVLCFSLYNWNEKMTIDIARFMHELNPNALVVFGGPQPDYTNTAWLEKNSFIDICVKAEGEEVLKDILEHRATDDDYSSIPGIVIHRNGKITDTGKPEIFWKTSLITDSPWIAQEERVRDVVNRMTDFKEEYQSRYTTTKYPRLQDGSPSLTMVWYTNKGCPYQCTFCDWGSVTNQKIRKLDQKALEQEIGFMQRFKIQSVYMADANFGVFDRDIELAKLLAKCKKETGYPTRVYVQYAKKITWRRNEITKILLDANLLDNIYPYDIQTTTEQVLKNIERRQSSLEVLREHILETRKTGVSFINTNLILGCPGETLDTWKNTQMDVLELSAHNGQVISHWMQFPNAPANTPEYREKWQIETVNKPTTTRFVTPFDDKKWEPATDILVSSISMPKSDWVESNSFAYFINAFHGHHLVKPFAFFMRHTLNVTYKEFYYPLYDLWKKYEKTKPIYDIFIDHFYRYIEDEDGIMNFTLNTDLGNVKSDNLTELGQVPPDVWLALECADRDIIDNFLRTAYTKLGWNKFFNETILNELLLFRNFMYLEWTTDPDITHKFTYDWEKYFSDISTKYFYTNYNIKLEDYAFNHILSLEWNKEEKDYAQKPYDKFTPEGAAAQFFNWEDARFANPKALYAGAILRICQNRPEVKLIEKEIFKKTPIESTT